VQAVAHFDDAVRIKTTLHERKIHIYSIASSDLHNA
jgi:hypothetical protein